MAKKKVIFLPELVEGKGRSWTVEEVPIEASKVDLGSAVAYVPKPHTEAQRLARLHEDGHTKYTPSPRRKPDWAERVGTIAGRIGERADPRAILMLLKMLEESRIDWLLWDRHDTDLRPAREALGWETWPDPNDLFDATQTVLQLAWTVWASRGLGKGIPNEPPPRSPDEGTGECFDKAWNLIRTTDIELARSIIGACLEMYRDPTDDKRDEMAYHLAQYFLREEEKEKEYQPKPKPEEKEKQEEAEQEEKEQEKYEEEQETGVGSEAKQEGRVEYHDHTADIRRPSIRVVRRNVPVTQGTSLKFPGRFFLDKAIFAERRLTEGGIMIDGSGSMRWTNADLVEVLTRLPAVTVGVYGGFTPPRGNAPTHRHATPTVGVIGRICTLAKQGRFCRFDKLDDGFNGANMVDLEALKLLATWPKPRLWLSDGLVCGGLHGGSCGHRGHNVGEYQWEGKLHEACNQWMKTHEILRVPDRATLMTLLQRKRVTLYRSTITNEVVNARGGKHPLSWPKGVKEEPLSFQL